MILFPLITAWMWFQIFTASMLRSSSRLADTAEADGLLLPVRVSFERG